MGEPEPDLVRAVISSELESEEPDDEALNDLSSRVGMMHWLDKWWRVCILLIFVAILEPWWVTRTPELSLRTREVGTAIALGVFVAIVIPIRRAWKAYLRIIEVEEAEKPGWQEKLAAEQAKNQQLRKEIIQLEADNSVLREGILIKEESTDAQLRADLEQLRRRLDG